MMGELKNIENNKTLSPMTPPKDCRLIGLKWVFKRKKNPDGAVIEHKARLVAKGYVQN